MRTTFITIVVNFKRYRAPASAGGVWSTRIGHGMYRVEGATEASLSSDVFVARLFQHSGRGLVGLSPSASSAGVRKLREPQP